MRCLLFSTPLVAMSLSAAVSVAAEPAGLWMPATATGCLVWSPLACSGGSAAWSGTCRNRRASGQGTLTLQCGGAEEQYVGQMRNGRPHGRGTRAYADGARYEGEWVWATGDRYEGDFVDGKRTGQGALAWATGDRCEGTFADGTM